MLTNSEYRAILFLSAPQKGAFFIAELLENQMKTRDAGLKHISSGKFKLNLNTDSVQVRPAQLEFDAGERLVGGTVDHCASLRLKDRTVTAATHVASTVG